MNDIPYWIIWISAAFALVTVVANAWNWRRARRYRIDIEKHWSDEAPRVPPVQVKLKTGDTLTIAPTNVHLAWIWLLPVPVSPDEVDELIMPELPPFTQIIPIQAR